MKANIQPNYLFVYGTLRKEFGLQLSKEIMNDLSFVSSGAINGELYDIGEYPAALPSENKDSLISGEIYKISHPRKVFKLLDEYEGYDKKHLDNSEYLRKKELLELESGEKIRAWVYWYNFPVNNKLRINQSDYLQYLKNKIA
jgi:gamma-glutamylcyclotransferase (GGCT)/AIG2-like uncharacterized protein YtfP